MPPRLSILLVTYNAESYIRWCLHALFEQTYQDFDVLVIDNGSEDSTRAVLADYARLRTIHNVNNLGFSRAFNQGFAFVLENNQCTRPDTILFMNPDIIFAPDALTNLMDSLDRHPEADVLCPKLRRFQFRQRVGDGSEREPDFLTVIDSAGIEPTASYRFVSRGEGEVDEGQYDREEFVWGFSGSCMLIRSRALERLKVKTREYFDEDFVMYKEDVDFCARLKRLGSRFLLVPRALGYHYRRIQGATNNLSAWNVVNNARLAFRDKAPLFRFYGYRNQLFFLFKNLSGREWFRKGLCIAWFEFRLTVFYLATNPMLVFRTLRDCVRLFKKLKLKRDLIQEIPEPFMQSCKV